MEMLFYIGVGSVGAAGVFSWLNGWLDRQPNGKWSRPAIKERLAHRLLASAAGDRARAAAIAAAMRQVVRLEVSGD